jgi:hypothetical protein
MAALLYGYDYARHHQRFAPVFGAVALFTAAGGHSVPAAYATWAGLAEALARGGGRLVPRSAQQWGRISIAMAFALLAAGVRRSLQRLDPGRS